MSLRFSHTSSLTKLILIVEFVLVAYLMYSLTKNVYNSYQLDRYIEAFQQENSALEAENLAKTEDYLYFTSEQYADKIAKQSLGLVNPGEEVIVLAPDVFEDDIVVTEGEYDADVAYYEDRTNPEQWWIFFFGE